jgi:fumarate hydratase class II
VLPEAVLQVVARVIGNDATVAWAAASGGQFELTTTMPAIGDALLESVALVAAVTRLFADRCVAGLEADERHCRDLAEASPSLVTALVPLLGHEEAAAVAAHAARHGGSIRDAVVARGHLAAGRVDAARLDAALDVTAMARVVP